LKAEKKQQGWEAEQGAIEATDHTFHTISVTVHDALIGEGTFSLDEQGLCFRALGGDEDRAVLRELEDAMESDEGGVVEDGKGKLKEGANCWKSIINVVRCWF
jgi:hypothetical protein